MTIGEHIFIDTSAWVALADTDDSNHKKAAGNYPSILSEFGRMVTSNLVIGETYILLLKELGHNAAFAFLEKIRTSPRIVRVYSTELIETEAEALLRKYDDHDFSYTDAVSFVIMKRQKLKKAFSFDKHFLNAGFEVLP